MSDAEKNDLKARRFDGNWKLAASGRQFMVRDLADDIETVYAALAADFSESGGRSLHQDARYPSKPGDSRALLLISEDQPGHKIGTTILLQRRGKDLFFELTAAAHTRLRWLHKVVRLALVATIFCIIYGTFYRVADQSDALVYEYARKYHPSDPRQAADSLLSGYRINSRDEWAPIGEPMTVWHVLKIDPKVFLLNTAGPPALILALVAIVIALLPPSSFDRLARFLGWPSAAEFSSRVASEVGSVDADACLLLGEHFGVREGDIRELRV